jgi:outer membrane protein assembly factor BamE (lipoprotein component of BamABCDE complex)
MGIIACIITSCSGTPRRYLAPDASIIKEGQNKEEVLQIMGHPNATRVNPQGREEWYYYEEHKSFLKKVPIARSYFGRDEVESIQVTFEQDKVVKVLYYVPVQR